MFFKHRQYLEWLMTPWQCGPELPPPSCLTLCFHHPHPFTRPCLAMPLVVDAVWAVWSITAGIYDYFHTSAIEERIHSLENALSIHQFVIAGLSAGLLLLITYILCRKHWKETPPAEDWLPQWLPEGQLVLHYEDGELLDLMEKSQMRLRRTDGTLKPSFRTTCSWSLKSASLWLLVVIFVFSGVLKDHIIPQCFKDPHLH